MANSGIVRRIDELGRIVIPKEIRRTMRLNEGDEMEITWQSDCLILRKYSGIESILSSVKSLAKLLANAIKGDVLFVNTAQVLVSEGEHKRDYQGGKIGENFAKILQSRQSKTYVKQELKDVFADRACLGNYVIVQPVISCGDLVGSAVLIVDKQPDENMLTHLRFCIQMIEAMLAC